MRPPLSIGERVVWMSDVGPESGIVKWIGFLHDTRDKEWTVGVEFVSTRSVLMISIHIFRFIVVYFLCIIYIYFIDLNQNI